MGPIKTAALAAGITLITSTAITVPEPGPRYVVRITYTADLDVIPYTDISRCAVTRAMTYRELPELGGFEKTVECVKIGG